MGTIRRRIALHREGAVDLPDPRGVEHGFVDVNGLIRSVSVAGGFGGATDSQTASGTLAVLALRDFTLAFIPAYTTSESVSGRQTTRVDAQTFTLGLAGLYRIARYVAVFAGYNFLHQRTGGPSSQQADIDQNRVRVGLQFGYPISFD